MPWPPWSPAPPSAAARRPGALALPPWPRSWKRRERASPTRKGAWPRVAERRRKPVPAAFYRRDPREVAVDLLNKLLIHDDSEHGPVGGLTGDLDGSDLSAGPVLLLDDGPPPPAEPGNSVRIGLSPGKGDESPWRWWVPGDPNVSRPAPRQGNLRSCVADVRDT